MHVALRRALAGAFIAYLTTVGALWPTAQAQHLVSNPTTMGNPPASVGGANLVIDDGVAENAIGLTAGGTMVWLNRFTPPPGDFPLSLVSAEVMFRAADNIPIGFAYDVFVYYDADGNPGNGAFPVGSALGRTVSVLDAFQVTTFAAPIVIPAAGDVLILVRANHTAGQFPAAIDQTSPQVRSWIGLGAGAETTPPTLPTATFGTIDSFGFPGNWMIRGTYTTGGGGGPVTYTCTDCPRPIPDFTTVPGSTTSTLVVPAGAPNPIGDVNVRFESVHTWAGDLAATLTKGATSVTFFDRPGRTTTGFGCTGDDPTFTANDEGDLGPLETSCISPPGGVGPAYVDGNYTPNAPLTAFDGQDAAGTWTLTVTDNAGGDTGSLTSWALIISDVTTAGEGGPDEAALNLLVAPNPIAGSAQAILTVAEAADVRVSIYDALGREVQVVFTGAVAPGQTAYIAFDTSRLPAGAYIVRASGRDFHTAQRVTIVR